MSLSREYALATWWQHTYMRPTKQPVGDPLDLLWGSVAVEFLQDCQGEEMEQLKNTDPFRLVGKTRGQLQN